MNYLPKEIEQIIIDYKNNFEHFENHQKKFKKTLNEIINLNPYYKDDEEDNCTIFEYELPYERLTINYYYVNNNNFKGFISSRLYRAYRSETEYITRFKENKNGTISRTCITIF